jgi:hypothetical protein
VESKQHERKSQELEILPETPYKTFVESKEKRKGRAEQQRKRFKAAREKEKLGSQKIGKGKN